MKSQELKEKVLKAEEKVNKCMATIERHKKQLEKKLAVIKEHGWNENDRYAFKGTPEYDDSYWAVCEYEGKLEDIKRAEDKIKDAEQILVNWRLKYDKQVELETVIATEMPEIFRECRDELAKEWQATDIRHREEMLKKQKELSYEEFRKLYKYTMEEDLRKTDEQFYQIELREAELFIIDLYNRVKAVTGEVTDWSGIHYGGKALNGFVTGKQGKAEVETILAGGYNIQRLHMRVLVKERA